MSLTLPSPVGSHAAAVAFGAVAVAVLPSAYLAKPYALGDYIAAICAKTIYTASAAETSYLADTVSTMTKMISPLANAAPDDVALADGKLVSKRDATREISIADVMRHGGVDRITQEKATKIGTGRGARCFFL